MPRRHAERTRKRRFVTPEGVDLRLTLGSAGQRVGAFLLDAVALLAVLIAVTVGLAKTATASRLELMGVLWLLGAFALRNFWFVGWEMGGRGATPGKRLLGLRVVARDGARLTGGAVIARNAMREVEMFLPLTFLGFQAAQGMADAFLAIFGFAWTGIFLLFPLFNRDRLRVGDLIAGTWVVESRRAKLGQDLAAARANTTGRTFTDAQLSLYGEYELGKLEEVLRGGQADAMRVVAAAIRRKGGIADDGEDAGFLQDYYAALTARLERGVMLGRRRADKFAPPARVRA